MAQWATRAAQPQGCLPQSGHRCPCGRQAFQVFIWEPRTSARLPPDAAIQRCCAAFAVAHATYSGCQERDRRP
eukprot:15430660-Alexandrium_andersonii.AAC.1